MPRVLRGLIAAALAGAALLGCRRGVGSRCKPGEALCQGRASALVCRNDVFVEVPCGGVAGCTPAAGQKASCDDSIAREGDACVGEAEAEYACTPERTAALLCRQGRFTTHLACRGKAGCAVVGRTVSCDTSLAAVGDVCRTESAVACADDQKRLLVCHEGKFEVYRQCRGQYGCYQRGGAPACDLTSSLEGDPCGLSGQVVCSTDKQFELVCQGGSFRRSRPCKKSGCIVTNRPGKLLDCE